MMAKTPKKPKSVVAMHMVVDTIRHLSYAEHIQRFHTVFEDVSPDLIPTHVFFDESRGGTRRFQLEEVKSLDTWRPLGGGHVELKYRGPVKGTMDLGIGYAAPPRENVYFRYPRNRTCNIPARADGIGVVLDLEPLLKRKLFDDALRLFENMIEYTQACYGRVWLQSRSTATYTLCDYPQYDWADPVEWNGVLIGTKASGGGPPVNCLPRFEPWINVLGREYVELLGRDKLLALDVYKKHEDKDGRLWLQITERPEQMHLPEVKEHVQRLMDSLDAADVFCRPPRTEEERENGIMDYRRPDFDWSHIPPLVIDNDPYSKHVPNTRIVINRRLSLQFTLGVSRQIMGNHIMRALLMAMLKEAVKKKGEFAPFGAALTEDDKLVKAQARKEKTASAQHQTEFVVEELARMREERPIKAAGVCIREAGPVSGLARETTAFKIHLENAAGDAYAVYLPFEEKNNERDYGPLLIDPGDQIIFTDAR